MPISSLLKKENVKIEPCILVAERFSVDRGVRYLKTDATVVNNKDGSEDATWETQRHYRNREEALEADRVYANARFKIRSKCVFTAIGYICPSEKESELDQAIEEARKMVDEANEKFKYCHIKFDIALADLRIDGGSTSAFKDALNTSIAALREALTTFDFKRVRNELCTTRVIADVLKDPKMRKDLNDAREEARLLANDMATVIREYQNDIETAMVSASGRKILARTQATWNF